MPQSDFSFGKAHRLKSSKLISLLFTKKSNKIYADHIGIRYMEYDVEDDVAAKVAFIVPKKLIRKATSRNHYRRKIKESYRLRRPHFYSLLNTKSKKVILLFYLHSEIENVEYSIINKEVNSLIDKLIDKI